MRATSCSAGSTSVSAASSPQQPIARPADLKKARPWVWRDDPVFPELMKIVGANGVALALPEVFPALQTKMVDTVIASPTAALGLQWFNHVKYMTKQADIALVGATLISQQAVQEHAARLPGGAARDRQAGSPEGARADRRPRSRPTTTRSRGAASRRSTPLRTPPSGTRPTSSCASHLTGKLFTKELLERVVQATKAAKK